VSVTASVLTDPGLSVGAAQPEDKRTKIMRRCKARSIFKRTSITLLGRHFALYDISQLMLMMG
jgi:hypothetical protein